MKYTFALLLVSLLAGKSYAQDEKSSLVALEEKYGFRDARFEADTATFKDLHRMTGNASGIETYWRDSEPKTIGDAVIKRTTYFFYKGKFYGIHLTTDSHADSQALLRVLAAKYGAGSAISAYQFEWITKRVAMNFSEKPVSGSAELFVISRVIKEQQDADDAKRAKKAASDL